MTTMANISGFALVINRNFCFVYVTMPLFVTTSLPSQYQVSFVLIIYSIQRVLFSWHNNDLTLSHSVFFTMVYAIAILFPPSYRKKVPWLLWTDGALKRNDEGIYSICPRASICSEGVVEIILISISRLTVFVSYTLMAQTFLSKMHCTVHYLSTTYLGKIVPFSQLHRVHTLNGRWFAILAILHTIGHFIRWIKRADMNLLGTQVGVSGLIAIVAMIMIVWAMSGQQERKTKDQMSKVERIKNLMNRTRGAKWVHEMTFEKRFNLHYYFMFILVAALLAHTPRCAIITAVFVGLWILDYVYGLLFKTFRLDLVEFTPVPNNSGVQMLWKNPIGFHANSGEYVKVQLPWLERGGSEWHPFSIYMNEATSEGMNEVLYGRNRLEAQEKEVITTSTALVMIEFQNEFAHVNGKLHEGVEDVMELTNMLENVKRLTEVVRSNGGKIIHVPYSRNKDELSNPQRHVGILKGIRAGKFFQEGTWNAEFFEGFEPKIADIVVKGKNGLDGFVGTDLQSQLTKHGIKTVIVAGYLTNICVESTVRSAYERGYNVITLTDGTACTSLQEQEAACKFSFPMFSQPMTCTEAEKLFLSKKPRKIRDMSLRQSDISLEFSELDEDSDDEELFSVDAEWQTNLDSFVMHVYNLNKKKNLTASVKEEHLILTEAREDLRSQYETTQIFVVPAGDWTKNVYKEVSERKQLRSCWVRGPFVSPYSIANNFSNLVLIATGIGITPALGVIGQYRGASRFKTLIWSTRCPQMLKFFAPLIKDCNLAIIYYTGKEILTDKEIIKLMSYGNIFIQRSRPDSLTKSTSTVITTTESLQSHEKYSSLDSLPVKTKKHWCLFYCGGSVGICEMFKTFSKENNINFEYELFDW